MLSAPAANRNKEPILRVLRQYFEANREYRCLEIASGTGEHVIHLAEHLPNVVFQPSECNPRYLHSIVAYVDKCRLPNIRVPLFIDVCKPPAEWALPEAFAPAEVDAMLNINMIHISSEAAIDGLFRAAGGLLKPGGAGRLFTYGPIAIDGVIRPQSNVDFDASLRAENVEWGLRDVADLRKRAAANGMSLLRMHEMPANNHVLVFERN